MTDAKIYIGRKPWLPCPEASNLDVWHGYELPSAGTFEADGDLVLFAAVGEVHDESAPIAWGYTVLDPDSVPNSFPSVDAMSAWIRERFSDSRSVFAYSRRGVIAFVADDNAWRDFYAGAADLFDQVIKDLESKLTSQRLLSSREAELRALETELIDA
ncbi:hypothetical protein [Aeromicrobium sp. 179-A 4D2 NHS]|uniref:hypothetical protein n=1 Tax=Aeromicrobium sp. 179-A 4D2 NHS TaxID=3142375 RepID=UPI00399FF785